MNFQFSSIQFLNKSQISKLQTRLEIVRFGAWKFQNFSFCKKNSGYTSIEIVVIMAIVVLVGAVTLVSFSGLGERGAINRSAQEFALAIRSAQNKALGVVRVGTATPPAVGVYLAKNSDSYFLFSDSDNNHRYASPPDVILGDVRFFPRNIRIDSLTAYPSGNLFYKTYIVFVTPEASATLADAGGVSLGNRLDIKLKTPSQGFTKTITVRVSGQISIK